MKIDLVGHEGGNSFGEFCFTLTVNDLCTAWTVNRPVRNKAARRVFEALEHVTAVFPFPIIGIDSDNDSEFINEHLRAYCHANQVTFPRCRPGNRNDGAHVEQKNWAEVPELVGYLRYDTAAELEKHRDGAKATKKHDGPATPHQRAIRHEKMRKRPITHMNAAFKQIKPGALSRQILAHRAAGNTLPGKESCRRQTRQQGLDD